MHSADQQSARILAAEVARLRALLTPDSNAQEISNSLANRK
jgi:hypothetical protein